MTKDELIAMAREAATETVDYDLMGNPITDADVLLMGAFGPLVLRFAKLAAEAEREACAVAAMGADEPTWFGYESPYTFQDGLSAAAAAIRARGDV